MTRAKERALEFLPSHPNEGLERQRKRFRQMYEAGYEQGQRDLALSPEDVAKIFNKVRDLQVKYPATEACFEEVAEWFNNLKEEKR